MKPNALLTFAVSVSIGATARAEDWGAFRMEPVSAPGLVLEAVAAGSVAGTPVSINKPSGAAHQKWLISPAGDGTVALRPAHNPRLALSAAQGGTKVGTPMTLEEDQGQPCQIWRMIKRDNGSYNLEPQHAPGMGMDDFGGNQAPGAKIDLWTCKENDPHLQWFVRPLAGSPAGEATSGAAAYEPPAIKPGEILPGQTKEFTFASSRIFPGTVRQVTVFIPAQYEGKKPACVYVKTDGYNAREKTLLETMIATREMPVTVGVFVRPGELPAPMNGTLGRRNRCFEYDGISDNNLRFFTEELLPYVAQECQLNLSTDGNDRCIAGGSSGGIAAFTAAWHRPEAFSRVYSASGSWVAFRGGHEFPTMVRKFEAKPIRAFLTTATRDMENAAGDWFLLDQEMDKALKFSGYDYQFRIIDGKHVAGYMEHWREAMAYLWRGWPERVQAGPSAPRAQEILIPGEGWQPVPGTWQDARSPACNAAGEVFFLAGNRIHRIGQDGQVTVHAEDSGQATGLAVSANGKVCSISPTRVGIFCHETGGATSRVAEGIRGNHLVAMPNGSFYVSSDDDNGSVWLIKDGQKTRMDTGLKHPTGLACRPDQWLLAVAEGASRWSCSYQIDTGGTLINKERFFWHHVADWDDDAGTESLCYSLEGRLFAATRIGIQIAADDGPTQVILPLPGNQRVLGVCLGGKGLDALFAFAGDKIWQRKVQHHAMGAFSPWTKTGGTKL